MNKESHSTYNVVIADRGIIFRQDLKRVTQEIHWLSVLGEASKGFELLKMIKRKKPDLAIINISLPKVKGVELTRAIKIKNPSIKVLILTHYATTEYIRKAFSSGADGYLLKIDYKQELEKAIETILRGEPYLSPSLSIQVEDLEKFNFLSEPWLTQRESEILQLIARGKDSFEISKVLGIATNTIKRHQANIMRKLNINSTAGLTKFAFQRGFVGPFDKDVNLESDLKDHGQKIARRFIVPSFKPSILRSIEFSPEHHEAGLTILSYF